MLLLPIWQYCAATKYRDVCEVRVSGGRELPWRAAKINANALMPQRARMELIRLPSVVHCKCQPYRRGRTRRQTVPRSNQAKQNRGLAKAAIVIKPINQQAPYLFCSRACQIYPCNPDNLIQHLCALSDYNNGATLIRAGMVHTHLFHRICKLARLVETPLCRM